MLLAIGATMVFSACYWDKADQLYAVSACNTDSVTFSGTIKPILDNNCALSGCHDATASGLVTLNNYNGAKTVALDGRMVGAINHASGYSPMPKNQPKLDDCTISKLTKWAAAGAPNN